MEVICLGGLAFIAESNEPERVGYKVVADMFM